MADCKLSWEWYKFIGKSEEVQATGHCLLEHECLVFSPLTAWYTLNQAIWGSFHPHLLPPSILYSRHFYTKGIGGGVMYTTSIRQYNLIITSTCRAQGYEIPTILLPSVVTKRSEIPPNTAAGCWNTVFWDTPCTAAICWNTVFWDAPCTAASCWNTVFWDIPCTAASCWNTVFWDTPCTAASCWNTVFWDTPCTAAGCWNTALWDTPYSAAICCNAALWDTHYSAAICCNAAFWDTP